jgi:radical SAM superfamily enzyme YgiQ (UPF0313 family)
MRNLRDTEDAVKMIQDRGIYFHASIVFGFDDDDPSIFDQTLEFLDRTKIPSTTFNVLTPYPGTELFDQFRAENRLLTENWGYYDHCTPTFLPRRMSAKELCDGYLNVKKSYFSAGRVLSRLPANMKTPLLFLLANLGLRLGLREERKLIRERAADLGLGGVYGCSPLVVPGP